MATNNDGARTRIKKANSKQEIAKILEKASSFREVGPGYMPKLKGLAKRRVKELKKS